MNNTIELNSLTRMAAMLAQNTAGAYGTAGGQRTAAAQRNADGHSTVAAQRTAGGHSTVAAQRTVGDQRNAADQSTTGSRAAAADSEFLKTAARIYAEQVGTRESVPAQTASGFSSTAQTASTLSSVGQPGAAQASRLQDVPAQACRVRSSHAQDVPVQTTPAQKDMDLEAYKQSIWEKISRLPMSASQKMGSVSVQISDAGFEAMKSDPEYEAWVLDELGQNFLFQNPWTSICGGTYSIHCFGAAKEEYRGSSWNAGYMGGQGAALFDAKAGKSFWEQRAERQEEFMEQQAKAAARQKMLMRLRMNGTPVSIAELLLGML